MTVSFPIPLTLAAPVNQLQTDLAAALANAAGLVARISATDAATVTTDANGVETAAAGLLAQPDATVASPAYDLATQARAIIQIVASPAAPVRTLLGLVNPNLFELAARYLGDATLWRSLRIQPGIVTNLGALSAARTTPRDPQPTGVYSIVVPGV